ncbi:hypothetical protein AAFC00_003156 [Neodothiora populina]|uniref:Uncharacterized protein n=1 Tax=Neodothiora populina TaxID=2781224 RepID=A0ABR3P9H6_9PEZI
MRPRAQSYRSLNNPAASRDNIKWVWRCVAIIAFCLTLGGFFILPPTFDFDPQLRVSGIALGVFGVAFLVVGFSLTGLLWLTCNNWLFLADFVFLPISTACTLGLLNTLYCFFIGKRYVWNIAALLTTIGSAVFALVYAVLFYIARRKAGMIRKSHESNVLLTRSSGNHIQGQSYHAPIYFQNHLANMYPASQSYINHELANSLDESMEEDRTRQQMLMLLAKLPESQISPDPSTSTFNRIDFTPTDEPEQPGQPNGSPILRHDHYGHSAPRSPVHSSNRSWGGSTAHRSWDGIRRTGPSIDPAVREQRRREIEQSR